MEVTKISNVIDEDEKRYNIVGKKKMKYQYTSYAPKTTAAGDPTVHPTKFTLLSLSSGRRLTGSMEKLLPDLPGQVYIFCVKYRMWHPWKCSAQIPFEWNKCTEYNWLVALLLLALTWESLSVKDKASQELPVLAHCYLTQDCSNSETHCYGQSFL